MTSNLMKIQPQHLNRLAMIYIRQSTMTQVRFHTESTERQYALQEKALQWGWLPDQIQLIDEDLGLSGSQSSNRQGFQHLVTQVTLGQVGAIVGLEISRLARSSADLLRLLELCALFDTIIIDEDGVYNLNDFNDRLILGFKGTMSEAELHFLRARLLGGKLNKARKGELRFPLPVGYCHDEDGKIIIDPDESVQTVVKSVFTAFQVTGSAYGVVKYFAEHGLRFPKRAYGGVWAGQLLWGELTLNRVLGLLKNPTYMGAYVFGRFTYRKKLNEGILQKVVVRVSQDQWAVLIHDHHPSYISWAEYEENKKQLEKNRTNTEVSGPAREGQALLQGLLLCGQCGHRLTVRYTGDGGSIPRYECRRRWENGRPVHCLSLRSEIVDQVVEKRLLEWMQPAQLELALTALDQALQQQDEMDITWRLSLERAQYEADRAYRQFDLAEPENRLVIRTLEAKWNEKLQALNTLQEEYDHFRSQRSWQPTHDERNQILALAERLPQLWKASTTQIKEKKRILRLLIEDITVTAQPGVAQVTVGIRWRNHFTEVLCTTKPLPQPIRRQHLSSTIHMIKTLAQTKTDSEIAAHFNHIGYRTPEGKCFTKASIRWLRYKHRIAGPESIHGDGLTVKEVAAQFGVSTHVVYYWINQGLLHAAKKAPHWPWSITMDEKTEKRLVEWVQNSSRIVSNPKPV